MPTPIVHTITPGSGEVRVFDTTKEVGDVARLNISGGSKLMVLHEAMGTGYVSLVRGSRYSNHDGGLVVTTASCTSNVVTITTSVPHGIDAGNVVEITGVANDLFNGTYVVASIPSATTFTFAKTMSNASSTGGRAVFYVTGVITSGTNIKTSDVTNNVVTVYTDLAEGNYFLRLHFTGGSHFIWAQLLPYGA